MASQEKNFHRSAVIGLIWLGATLLGGYGMDGWNAFSVKGWPTVDGIVERSRVKRIDVGDDKPQNVYVLEVEYLYVVDGNLVRGYRPQLFPTDYASEKAALSKASRSFTVGATAKVTYDPKGAKGSYLEVGRQPSHLMIGGGLGLLVLAMILAYNHRVSVLWFVWVGGMSFGVAFKLSGSSLDFLESDVDVKAADDPRPFLKLIAAVEAPKEPTWNDVKVGQSLEQVLALVGQPLDLEMRGPNDFQLRFAFEDKGLSFHRGVASDPYLLTEVR